MYKKIKCTLIYKKSFKLIDQKLFKIGIIKIDIQMSLYQYQKVV